MNTSQANRWKVARWVERTAHTGVIESSLLAAVILALFAGALRAAM